MPEYQLDKGNKASTFDRLDAFTQGYVTAMFWTECNSDSEDMAGKTFADLAVPTLAHIKVDCREFQKANASILALAYAGDEYGEERAGHDYWLTRNGHGTGFWDRDELTKIVIGQKDETTVGSVLYHRCRNRTVDLYAGDDGKLYIMGAER